MLYSLIYYVDPVTNNLYDPTPVSKLVGDTTIVSLVCYLMLAYIVCM